MPLPMIPMEALTWAAALFVAPFVLLGVYAVVVTAWITLSTAAIAPREEAQPVPQPAAPPKAA